MSQKNDFFSSLQKTNRLEIAWLLTLMASKSFEHRTAMDSLAATIDSTHLLRFAFDGLAFSLIATQLNPIPKLKFNPLGFFLLYIFICIISTVWSASPVGTLAKSGEVFLGVFIVLKTLHGKDNIYRLRRLIDLFILFHSLILSYGLIGYFLYPDSFSHLSHGLLPRRMELHIFSADSVSNYSAFLATTFLARYLSPESHKKNKNDYVLLYFYFVFILILGQGRTGMAILVAGTFLLFLITRPVSTILFSPFLVGGVVYFFWETLKILILRGQNEQMFLSLTMRTVIWERAWHTFLEDPFFGKGFAIGSRVMFSINSEGFADSISSVHNGFLEVLLGVGIIGFLFWFGSFAGGMMMAVRALVRKKHLDVAIGFIYLFMTTIMNSGAGGWWAKPLAFFLVAIAYLTAQKMRERAQKNYGVIKQKSDKTHVVQSLDLHQYRSTHDSKKGSHSP